MGSSTSALEQKTANVQLRDTVRQLPVRLADRIGPMVRAVIIGDLADVIMQYAIGPVETFADLIEGHSFKIDYCNSMTTVFDFNNINADNHVMIKFKIGGIFQYTYEFRLSKNNFIKAIDNLSLETVIRFYLAELRSNSVTIGYSVLDHVESYCEYVICYLNDYFAEKLLRG